MSLQPPSNQATERIEARVCCEGRETNKEVTVWSANQRFDRENEHDEQQVDERELDLR